MRWKFSAFVLFVSLGFAGVPTTAVGQGDSESESTASESESESEASESESAEATGEQEAEEGAAEGDEQTGDEQTEDQTAGQAGEESEGAGTESASSDEGAQKESAKGAESGEKEGPKRGPGGREMRSDYPGTDEAMQEQMETDRIEGLQFEEGGEPADAYDVEIQELETKIDDLKEKVFQSKSRVVLLKETVLGGNLSGSRAMIVHNNDLGSNFKLQRAMYSLDGNRVFNESRETGNNFKKDKFKVYDGSISTGTHNVSVLLRYKGNSYGVFNYMKGYDFKITSSCQFKAEAGKATILRIQSVNKAGAFADVEKKPGIKCEIETKELTEKQGEGADGGSREGASESGSKGTAPGRDGAGAETP